MSSLFVNVFRQALKTFDRGNQSNFHINYHLLKQLTEQLNIDDIFTDHPDLMNEEHFTKIRAAPCTFVNIFENADVSMSVFILRNGYKMPLHDHPHMYGILRGIYGELLVQSFTAKDKESHQRNIQHVYIESPLVISPATNCATLTPTERNFHEITAVNGVAAFFDILGPPYGNTRRCNFYKYQLSSNTLLPSSSSMSKYTYDKIDKTTTQSGKTEHSQQEPIKSSIILESIPLPTTYYCDTAPTPSLISQCTHVWYSNFYSKKL